METLEPFQQNRRVIEDFTSHTLAAISSDFGRLLYVATLRDLASGRYRHEGLAALYSEAAVHEALFLCHQEVFSKVLELPLERQVWDLRLCLAGMDGDAAEISARWLEVEFYRLLVPFAMPEYLRRLFFSNMRALLSLILDERASMATAA